MDTITDLLTEGDLLHELSYLDDGNGRFPGAITRFVKHFSVSHRDKIIHKKKQHKTLPLLNFLLTSTKETELSSYGLRTDGYSILVERRFLKKEAYTRPRVIHGRLDKTFEIETMNLRFTGKGSKLNYSGVSETHTIPYTGRLTEATDIKGDFRQIMELYDLLALEYNSPRNPRKIR